MDNISSISAGATATTNANATQTVTPISGANPSADSKPQPTRFAVMRNTVTQLLKMELDLFLLLLMEKLFDKPSHRHAAAQYQAAQTPAAPAATIQATA